MLDSISLRPVLCHLECGVHSWKLSAECLFYSKKKKKFLRNFEQNIGRNVTMRRREDKTTMSSCKEATAERHDDGAQAKISMGSSSGDHERVYTFFSFG